MEPLLTAKNLSIKLDKPVLKSVSFDVHPGELLLVLGPSGSGKSTLLRCLNRLQPVDSGTVTLHGENTCDLDVRQLRRRLGMVFQVPALLPGTVQDNILQGPALDKRLLTGEEIRDLIVGVGLPDVMLTRRVDTLSIGEQQRVAFAQTLANQPEVLLLDEPTSALDPTAVLTLEKLILKIHREKNRAIVMVTHNIPQALRFNAETLVLLDGRVIARGPIHELVEDRNNDTLIRFFQGRLNGDGNSDEL